MKIITFFIYSTIIYIGLLFNFEYKNFHIYSLIAMTLSLIIISILDFFDKTKIKSEYKNKKRFSSISKEILNTPLIFTILAVNATINIINIIFISNMVVFETSEAKSMFQILPSITVFIAQIGGWFFQAVLVYILATLFDSENKFSMYLKIIGVAYLGFLISSFIGIFYNFSIIENQITLNELKTIVNDSPTHIILGKLGEYITITIASYLIFVNEKFSEIKSLLITSIPSIIILSSQQFFSWYAN